MRPSSYTVRRRRTVTLLLMLLYGTACQAWHVQPVAPESLLAPRRPATLRVTRTDGSHLVLEHAIVRAGTLLGTVSAHGLQQEIRIPLTDVRQVETRGFSAGRTVELGLAGLFVALVVAVAIVCSSGVCGPSS